MNSSIPPEEDFYKLRATRAIIEEIINVAHVNEICEPTCYHLVGALLAIRFGEFNIALGKYNHSPVIPVTDYWIDDTAFHVAVHLTERQIKQILVDLECRFVRIYLLVPEFHLAIARGIVLKEGLKRHISVESIESFVGTLLDAMSCYNAPDRKTNFKRLIRAYNARISEAEQDRTLLIAEECYAK